MSEFLTRDQILQVEDIVFEEVPVPEWGGKVLVRALTGSQRDTIEATIVQATSRKSTMNLDNARAKFVAWGIVDPKTKARLFADADVVRLGKKSAAALQRVFNVVQRLSGLSDEDLEEMTKNSGSDQSDDSGLGLQDTSAAA